MPNNPSAFSDHLVSAARSNRPIISLLTDFGERDGFIGVMKGVMLGILSDATFVDISHELPPYSIDAAAFLNHWSFGYFPVGTVHLCVVDPGVGTSRRGLAVQSQGHFFVAPDNGVLTPVLQSDPHAITVSLSNRDTWLGHVSNTFHGRDIFSPVAAHLASGRAIDDMGERIPDPVLLPHPPPTFSSTQVTGCVRYVDRFGNLVTSIERPALEEWAARHEQELTRLVITAGSHEVHGISTTYGDHDPGTLIAVFDGFDALEVAVTQGNAANHTGLQAGAPITILLSGT